MADDGKLAGIWILRLLGDTQEYIWSESEPRPLTLKLEGKR